MNDKPDIKTESDDDTPANIDFSKGVRGKFYSPNAKLNLPVYLDEDVQAFLSALASKKGVDMSDIANDLLKKDIALLDVLR
ncbi:MAG: hypothetical protein HY253_04465 [Burkholderiales bacterium]|nr:hypothetical protein [Burkholderiales bacterium]